MKFNQGETLRREINVKLPLLDSVIFPAAEVPPRAEALNLRLRRVSRPAHGCVGATAASRESNRVEKISALMVFRKPLKVIVDSLWLTRSRLASRFHTAMTIVPSPRRVASADCESTAIRGFPAGAAI